MIGSIKPKTSESSELQAKPAEMPTRTTSDRTREIVYVGTVVVGIQNSKYLNAYKPKYPGMKSKRFPSLSSE